MPQMIAAFTSLFAFGGAPLLLAAFMSGDRINPLFGAALVVWIFSVCLHEFSHALVAFWGGDSSVRDKGYLRFDPLSYIHPITSILIPVAILAIGGVPLPGGAVYIDRDRLRGKYWESAVSAAGPVSNFLLFLIFAAIVHPDTGLVDPLDTDMPTWARLCGVMCVLQLYAVMFNLIPLPPLDGAGIIRPFLDYETRRKFDEIGMRGLVFLMIAFFVVDAIPLAFVQGVSRVLMTFGLPYEVTWEQFFIAFGN